MIKPTKDYLKALLGETEELAKQKAQKERDIDAILDKVAKNGYASLTDEEKTFLFKNS